MDDLGARPQYISLYMTVLEKADRMRNGGGPNGGWVGGGLVKRGLDHGEHLKSWEKAVVQKQDNIPVNLPGMIV